MKGEAAPEPCGPTPGGARPDVDLSEFGALSTEERQRLLDASSDEARDAATIRAMMDRGVASFDPTHLAGLLVGNTRASVGVYGEPFLEDMTGLAVIDFDAYEGHPERRGELVRRIQRRLGSLLKAGYFVEAGDGGFAISERGEELASVSLLMDELEGLSRIGRGDHTIRTYGEREHGDPVDVRPYRRGDSFRDIAVRQSLKRAVVRGRSFPLTVDLRTRERTRNVSLDIVYALDVSGSMHGDKVDAGKRAAVGLAVTGTKAGDRVGVVAFNVQAHRVIEPTPRVEEVARRVAPLRPALGTDIAAALRASREMLLANPSSSRGRHVILISDAIPTTGDEDPVGRAFEEASLTAAADITISLVGIDLSEEGEGIGRSIARIGKGRFYHITNPKELDRVVLEERDEARLDRLKSMGLMAGR